ncbi:MAG: hypothetical protein A2939_02580 [Parcubacteria group bacterium RIFCSPLOWO2_01_FULL_48_18]|nr:MAG: hypothetical protein A2939_02580 [Parcubacteria group bacterium RIFCSPLOWO2_01_FULL_48_18]OHB23666.1 MAG: hypothetical protein A3J67_06295 [Parcubacteria group bacterium RIFCSPHIGHO2_02_FULL_48_10b]
MLSIGIDIGASKILGIVYDSRRKKIARLHIAQTEGPRSAVAMAEKLILEHRMTGKGNIPTGIAIAGVVKNNTVVRAANMKGWNGINLKAAFRHFDISVFRHIDISRFRVENDAQCFGYAESLIGYGKNKESAVFLTLGSGIGGAILLNGSFYRGAHGSAGEVGHTVAKFVPSKVEGRNSKFETLEWEYLAAKRFFAAHGVDDPKELEDKARKGNKKALNMYREFGVNLGVGLANIINTLDPEIIILGGGLAHTYDLFIAPARQTIKRFVVNPAASRTKIVKSKIAWQGAAIGAALMAINRVGGKLTA